MSQVDRLPFRARNEEDALPLGLEPLALGPRVLVQEVVAVERLLEPHDPKARLRVLREVGPRQHGARQFLVLEGTAALHELHRDLHGAPPERAAAEEVAVLRTRCPQLHEQLRELPRRERPP